MGQGTWKFLHNLDPDDDQAILGLLAQISADSAFLNDRVYFLYMSKSTNTARWKSPIIAYRYCYVISWLEQAGRNAGYLPNIITPYTLRMPKTAIAHCHLPLAIVLFV